MFQRVARLALAAALLAAWQAALQHPIEHVDALGEFVHVYGGHSPEDGGPDAAPLCDLLAALTACAASTDAALPRFQSDYESPANPASVPRAAEAPPFLSQGPPASV
jgi:hypothetical protein